MTSSGAHDEGFGPVVDSYPPLGNDWDRFLSQQLDEKYMRCLLKCIEQERSCYNVYPPPGEVFEALRLTPRAKTRAVIVGQDPYHRPGLAHGLAFSVPRGMRPLPTSLRNILRAVERDGFSVNDPSRGNLEGWACRGVLLLNAALTVREGVPGSHRGMGWEMFTDLVIQEVEREGPVFLLWGKEAQRKEKMLRNTPKEMIVKSPHPRIPAFRESAPFRRANEALRQVGKEPIDRSLTE